MVVPWQAAIKQLSCQTPNRRINLAWISLQNDGSLSFGLNDKTYISPRFMIRQWVWSAYNRVRAEYLVTSDPAALHQVRNPHFSYHPSCWFHLKEHGASNEDALFSGIADLPLTLRQDLKMPWLRATTGPLLGLKPQRPRSGAVIFEEMTIAVPSEEVSVRIELDFLNVGTFDTKQRDSLWFIPGDGYFLRVGMSFTYPQISTLGWFHSY